MDTSVSFNLCSNVDFLGGYLRSLWFETLSSGTIQYLLWYAQQVGLFAEKKESLGTFFLTFKFHFLLQGVQVLPGIWKF